MSVRRVAVVTGVTGAIGRAIVEALAEIPGHQLVLVARDAAKAERVRGALATSNEAGAIRVEIADLSRRASIMDLAARCRGPVHLLINNAAVAPRARAETPEGIELQLATNVLGYLWMTRAFAPALAAGARDLGAPSRIVNVASYWAGDLDIDDLEFRRRSYDNDTAYRQSKQANRMLTVAQAEELGPERIVVNACHPGDVSSKLSNDLGFGGHESAKSGARTPVWLATSPDVAGVSGRYFERMSEQRCRFGADRSAVARLARVCEAFSR